jgi:hypothetical protein
MKRSEFLKVCADYIDNQRVKNFPDMRPSERAASRMDSDRVARRMWTKHREVLTEATATTFREELERSTPGALLAKPPQTIYYNHKLRQIRVYEKKERTQ